MVPKRLGDTHACFFYSFSFSLLVFSPFPLLSLILLSSSLELLFTAFPSFMPGGHCAQQRSLVPSVAIRCISILIQFALEDAVAISLDTVPLRSLDLEIEISERRRI